jgi:hypothetical protein
MFTLIILFDTHPISKYHFLFRATHTTYMYDSNDNVIAWNRYSNSSGALQNIEKVEATYDTNPNPYRDLGMTHYVL